MTQTRIRSLLKASIVILLFGIITTSISGCFRCSERPAVTTDEDIDEATNEAEMEQVRESVNDGLDSETDMEDDVNAEQAEASEEQPLGKEHEAIPENDPLPEPRNENEMEIDPSQKYPDSSEESGFRNDDMDSEAASDPPVWDEGSSSEAFSDESQGDSDYDD